MNKILIIQTAFIGDVILSTCLIEKLNNHYPEAVIDFALRKGNENILKNNPHINKIHIWNKKGSKYWNLFKTIKQIRKEKYDLVVNVQRFSSSGLMTRFSKGMMRIGFENNPQSKHFDSSVKHVIGAPGNSVYTHEVDRCLKLVEDLTDSSYFKPKIYPGEEEFDKIKEFIVEDFISISPKSVWFTKQFPEERWIELINEIDDKKIYLLGGPGDFQACQNIVDKSNSSKVENLAGKLSLIESGALMSKAIMNYTNDSAPMHLCSASNAPVTAVFCSTVKEFGFGPLSDDSHIVEVRENLPCRPCGLHGLKSCPEGHFNCARLISRHDLLNKIQKET